MKSIKDTFRDRKTKNIMLLIALILVIVVVVFLVSTYIQFSNSGLSAADMVGKTYFSIEKSIEVTFDETTAELSTELGRVKYTWTYDESVLTLKKPDTEEVLRFWVMDGSTLFSDEYRTYFYQDKELNSEK